MALTIENGTGVAGADSYATAAELATYAANYGLTVPADATAQEKLLRRAAVAMNALRWRGERTEGASQPLAWPRTGIVAFGDSIGSDAIPDGIKSGQMALAAEIHADDLAPPDEAKGAVVEETVDVLTVKYAERRRVSYAAPRRQSLTHFAPYLAGGGGIAVLRA
jgi:hypothetical protein